MEHSRQQLNSVSSSKVYLKELRVPVDNVFCRR